MIPKLRKAAALVIVNPIYKARNLFKTKWKVTGRKVALEFCFARMILKCTASFNVFPVGLNNFVHREPKINT